MEIRRVASKLIIVLGLILIVSGICTWSNSMKELDVAVQSLHWPTTRGVITESGLRTKEDHERYQTFYRYECKVSYEYQVGSRLFTGTRVSYATAADHYVLDRHLIERLHERFHKGAVVEVHYEMRAPENAVLLPGVEPEHVSLRSYDFLWIGVISLVLGPIIGSFRPGPNTRLKALLLALPVGALSLGFVAFKPILVTYLVPPSAVLHLSR